MTRRSPASTPPGERDVVLGIRLADGSRGVPSVEQTVVRLLPRGSIYYFETGSSVEGKVQRAVRPESIALGAFGAIAALRRTRDRGPGDLPFVASERHRSRSPACAARASPATSAAETWAGALGAVVLGSLLASAFAMSLSSLSPLGPVRSVYPYRGLSIDWASLGIGGAGFIVVLGAFAIVLAYRGTPQRPRGKRW